MWTEERRGEDSQGGSRNQRGVQGAGAELGIYRVQVVLWAGERMEADVGTVRSSAPRDLAAVAWAGSRSPGINFGSFAGNNSGL